VSGILAVLALSRGSGAEDLRAGTEFQVNTFTANEQIRPSLSSSPAGDFVVTWASDGQDGAGLGVFGQRFARTGVPLGAEIQIPVRISGHESHPSVAVAAGGFVVAWHGGPPASDGSQYGIFARRFASNGTPLADEFQVNTYTPSFQANPSVAAAANGDFVVAWQSTGQDGPDKGVFGRRFSSAGTPLAAEFQVGTYTEGDQLYANVAMDTAGDFVVVWQSLYQDGDAAGVFGRRFSSTGAPLAGEFQVATFTGGDQAAPAVTSDADGDFVVAWQSNNGDYAPNIFAQRFSSAGSLVGGEIRVNEFTPGPQARPSVRAQANGDFVVAWDSQFEDGSNYGIVARRYSSAGLALEAEIVANTYVTGDQNHQSLAVDSNGDFVVAWESGRDGSYTGIFAQRFGPLDFDVDGNGATGALTDGLLTLRYLFGFRGATLVTGAVGAGCTRCDAPSIEAYLMGIAQ
jgi:hypothetical protein